MCTILCDFLRWMYYSFSQNMVDNVQSWPEYNELREILQNMVVEVQHIIELVREVYMRGNVSITANVTKFVIFCTHVYKPLWYGTVHRSDISKWQIFKVYRMEGKNISLNCEKMPVKYQSTWPASEERSKKRTFWTLSKNDKYSRVTFGVEVIWNNQSDFSKSC